MVTACGMFSGGSGDKSGTGWKVWVKTSPCSGGRTDWISVAKTNPTEGGGGSYWQTADIIQVSAACTRNDSCTFDQATASANAVRASQAFSNYCCKDFSVYRNSQTGAMSDVQGKHSTAGFGWDFVKGNLCCEEAEQLAGIPGACSSSSSVAPPLGPVRRTPSGNSNTTTAGGGTDYNGGGVTSTPYVNPTPPPYNTPPAVSNRWILVSVTAIPETPPQGWSYGGTQASATSSNGDRFIFQWSQPPQQIDANGFTISGIAQCQSTVRCSGLMNIGGSGIESDTPRAQWDLYANGANGSPGNSGQRNITFKPSSSASELEVEIGLMWGTVRFKYKYQRAQ